jgi:ABC-type multidrug transport system ATPase subunit
MPPEKKTSISIEASEITKGFRVGDEFRTILSNLSFSVPSGMLTFISGPNGIGKTLFGQILCGLLPADSGTVKIDGKRYPRLDRATAKSLGVEYLPQRLPKPENISPIEFLSLAGNSVLYSPGTIRNDLKELQSRVELPIPRNLTERISERTRNFELQGLYLAKALMSRCRLLFLDEPTAYLSSEHAKELIRILNTLVAQGITVVVIAHPEQQALEGSRSFFRFTDSGITPGQEQVRSVFQKPSDSERLLPIAKSWSVSIASQFKLEPGTVVCVKGTATRDFFEFADSFKNAPPALIAPSPFGKKLKVAFISENESERGIAGGLDLLENCLIHHWESRYWTFPPRLPAFIKRHNVKTLLMHPVLDELNVQQRKADFLAKNLSGGNKQRLVISRTCFGDIDLLLAVGLFNGLDDDGVYRVSDYLARKSATGMITVLFSTRFGVEEILADVTLKYESGRLFKA